MPLVLTLLSGFAGIVTGVIYEKENNKKLIEATTQAAPSLNFWDKCIMAAAGIAAYYVYRSSK